MHKKNFKLQELVNHFDRAIKDKELKKARLYCEKIIHIKKDITGVYYNLGKLELSLENYNNSIELFLKTLEIDPNLPPVEVNLGLAYSKSGNDKLAIKHYKHAINLDPKSYIAHFNLGSLYKKLGDLQNSEKYLTISIKIKPKIFYSYNNLFELYDKSNQIEKLDELVRKIKINFNDNPITEFYSGVLQYKKKNYFEVIKTFEKIKLDQNDLKRLTIKNEILAKSYDSTGNYKKAFFFFEQANNSVSKIYKNKFDKKEYLNFIKKRSEYFVIDNLKKWKPINYITKINDPIFLIGFPRSGTTLLDTILRSHSSIEVLEEEPIIDEVINNIEKEINNDFSKLENLDENLFYKVRKIYFEKRNQYVKYDKNKVFIDKLPLNIVNIGEITRFFPKSKFILALRNPYDSVLSCFMQTFSLNHAMSNFLNIDDAAKLYDSVMSLWFSYSENLHIKSHTIKYENVVENFDKTINDLINFLELEWSDDLKNFNKTAIERGIINTPSYDQVNLPLYNKSINRWKNYENNFFSVKDILNKWVKKFNYS
jgi:tetratricopeptide (TPR) repeat protein